MTEPGSARSQLLDLLRRIPLGKETDDVRERILAEGLATIYAQLLVGLQVQEEPLVHITDALPMLDGLPSPVVTGTLRMTAICIAPGVYTGVRDTDSAFSDALRQARLLIDRIELNLGTSAWLLYAKMQELEARSREMDEERLGAAARLIAAVYRRIMSSLNVNSIQMESIREPTLNGAEWGPAFPAQARVQAVRIIEICRRPELFLSERIPIGMVYERFRAEAARIDEFLSDPMTTT